MRKIVPSACGAVTTGLCAGLVMLSGAAGAQVIPDGTLPTTVTSPNNLNFAIDGGSRSGNNLFHSFRQFSVPTGGSAVFNNAATIQNIFSRVTGGSVSNIDGAIRANGTANLFLLNPSGILFGPNASLNIGGSFIGTTANGIQFADGVEFSAVNANGSPLLTMSVPIGLQMGQDPSNITVQGFGHRTTGGLFTPLDKANNPIGLQVNPGNTLALIGGNVVSVGGILTASGGQVTLGAVQAGIVGFDLATQQWDYRNAQTWGDLNLQQQSLVDASGVTPGSIQLYGRNITLADGSWAVLQNYGTQPAGDITVRATAALTLKGLTADGHMGSRIVSQSLGGKGSNIDVQAGSLLQQEGGRMTTQTFTVAPGGNLTLNILGAMRLEGYLLGGPTETTWNSTVSFGAGRAGDIISSSRTLTLINGAQMLSLTFGTGQTGDLLIRATDTIDLIGMDAFIPTVLGSTAFNRGDAGNVIVDTAKLTLTQGAGLVASTLAAAAAGSLTITASESVTVKGRTPGTTDPSRIISGAEKLDPVIQQIYGLPPVPTGNSGSVAIYTPKVDISDGGEIAVRNDGPGNAGNLTIRAQAITLTNQGRITAATITGEGGNIVLNSDLFIMREQSAIVANAGGAGKGGSISLTSPIILGLENSDIIANAVRGSGGNISITTQGILGLAFRNTLTPRQDPTNDITASSQFSVNGTVQINNIGVDPNAGLVNLPVDLADPTQQIAQGCAANQGSSFVVTGRGGVPLSPMEQVRSDRPWQDLRDLSAYRTHPVAQAPQPPTTPAPLIQATGWRRNADGKVELFAETNSTDTPITTVVTCARTR